MWLTSLLPLAWMVLVPGTAAFGGNMKMSLPGQDFTKVLVTGAAGRTGRLVFSSLNDDSRFDAVGLVRTEESAKKLIKAVSCGLDEVVVSDVTVLNDKDALPRRLEGANAMVICTSAVPVISKRSVVKAMLKIPANVLSGKKAFNFRDLQFKYRSGQYPERVDYEGQVNQIRLAKSLGISHVVIVSSMGGTDPTNFLNSIGKDKNGNGNGDILVWKRQAEKYLVDSGLHFTIIHPGGLTDAPPSIEKLVLDIDDKLINEKKRSISRADVANLCVAALTIGRGRNVSFDCISQEVEKGTIVPSAEDALKNFLSLGKTTSYED